MPNDTLFTKRPRKVLAMKCDRSQPPAVWKAGRAFGLSLRPGASSRLLRVHFLPELLRRLAVDRLQGRDRSQGVGVTLRREVAVEGLQWHATQRREVGNFRVIAVQSRKFHP